MTGDSSCASRARPCQPHLLHPELRRCFGVPADSDYIVLHQSPHSTSPPSPRLTSVCRAAPLPGAQEPRARGHQQLWNKNGQARHLLLLLLEPLPGQRGNNTGHGLTIATAVTVVRHTNLEVPVGTEDKRSLEKRYLPQAHVPKCPPGPQASSGQEGSTEGGHGAHPHLHNDGEEYHHDGRCHKVVLGFHLFPVQQDD